MKKMDIIVFVLVLLGILVRFSKIGNEMLAAYIMGTEVQSDMLNYNIRLWGTAFGIFTNIVNIAIGIWLFLLAKKENEKGWIWFLFGCVYGIMAPILFFVVKCWTGIKQIQDRIIQQPFDSK